MTNLQLLRIAVVGHTNTGKTSLMRTLMRDVTFGDVSDRPAVTRHVEGARITIAAGAIDLFDTPGLEDSPGLIEQLDAQRSDRQQIGIEQVRAFLESDAATTRFAQEAKAIQQVLAADVALYVIDSRDRVLPKFRDELEILSRCARPVVPVLNFIATEQANTSQWRAALAELNLHAVAEFDTVVYDHLGEIRLFEKMRTLLDPFRPLIDGLIEHRQAQRRELIAGSTELIADLLVDAAAHRALVALGEKDQAQQRIEQFRDDIRQREQRCVDDLLQLHRFTEEDYDRAELPLESGQWGPDLFSPAALKQFGIRTGSGVAAGAATGLALDVMFGGLSLGAWTALGASVGAALGAGRTHGRRLLDRMRGVSELRCDDSALQLLLVRQTALLRELLRRGHAAVGPIRQDQSGQPSRAGGSQWARRAIDMLAAARINPNWSMLGEQQRITPGSAQRDELVNRLASVIRDHITSPTDEPS